MRVDDRTHAVFICTFADGADIVHKARPFLRGKARRSVGMSGCIVALIMPPVHNSHVRGGEFLPFMTGQRGQRRVCNQFADIINCIQDTFLIGRVEQVVEDGARDDCQAIPVQLFRNECRVDWQIAVGAKFNRAVPAARAANTGFGGRLRPSSRVRRKYSCSCYFAPRIINSCFVPSQDLTTLFRCGMLLLYRIRKKNPLLSYICF